MAPVSGPLRGEMDVTCSRRAEELERGASFVGERVKELTEMGASKVKGAAEDEKSRPFNDTVRGTVEGGERGERHVSSEEETKVPGVTSDPNMHAMAPVFVKEEP